MVHVMIKVYVGVLMMWKIMMVVRDTGVVKCDKCKEDPNIIGDNKAIYFPFSGDDACTIYCDSNIKCKSNGTCNDL